MRIFISALIFLSLLSVNLGMYFVPTVMAQSAQPEVADSPSFDPNVLFPTWVDEDPSANEGIESVVMDGIIGENNDKKRVWQYIPRIIDLLLKITSPIVVVMAIYAGVLFIYAGDSEDEITKAKKYFMYAVIGLIVIMLSYSLMRGIYYFLAT